MLHCFAVDTGELMVIRACVMKTMDTQCGVFRYQDYTMTGCILTCDYDGCNSANPIMGDFNSCLSIGAFAAFWIILKYVT